MAKVLVRIARSLCIRQFTLLDVQLNMCLQIYNFVARMGGKDKQVILAFDETLNRTDEDQGADWGGFEPSTELTLPQREELRKARQGTFALKPTVESLQAAIAQLESDRPKMENKLLLISRVM